MYELSSVTFYLKVTTQSGILSKRITSQYIFNELRAKARFLSTSIHDPVNYESKRRTVEVWHTLKSVLLGRPFPKIILKKDYYLICHELPKLSWQLDGLNHFRKAYAYRRYCLEHCWLSYCDLRFCIVQCNTRFEATVCGQ
jgi:hypothetical protein